MHHGICISELILDSREGMTAKLQTKSPLNQHLRVHHLARPRPYRGAKSLFCVYSPFVRRLHRLHQELVALQVGNLAALLFVETPLVPLMSVNSRIVSSRLAR